MRVPMTLAVLTGFAILFVANAASARVCVGDCNLDDVVDVGEIVGGISIALGRQSMSTCPRSGSTR